MLGVVYDVGSWNAPCEKQCVSASMKNKCGPGRLVQPPLIEHGRGTASMSCHQSRVSRDSLPASHAGCRTHNSAAESDWVGIRSYASISRSAQMKLSVKNFGRLLWGAGCWLLAARAAGHESSDPSLLSRCPCYELC